MRKNGSNIWLLIVLIVVGFLLGGVLSELTKGAKYFDWLSIGKSFGISVDNPFLVDLGIIQFKFGLMFNVTVAGVIGIILAILAYRKFR